MYFYDYFGPGWGPDEQVLLRALDIMSRPIPTTSTWGLSTGTLVFAIAGALIIRSRARARYQLLAAIADRKSTRLNSSHAD